MGEDEEGDPVEKKVVVTEDEGIRPGVTAEKLAKIKPAFKKDGSTSAGNASQVTDGAALVLLMKRSFAEKHGYPVLAKYIGCWVVGVPPEIMGIGPAVAIPKALQKTGLKVDDISVFEINDAFALGHPMGATGARQYATILPSLKPGEIGLTSMCIGTGMGAASVIVRE